MTPVEVFVDVVFVFVFVFVFTLTQLTRILEADLTVAGFGRVLLLFGILCWMFDGYVGLANHVPPRLPAQKLLLFLGMVGFLPGGDHRDPVFTAYRAGAQQGDHGRRRHRHGARRPGHQRSAEPRRAGRRGRGHAGSGPPVPRRPDAPRSGSGITSRRRWMTGGACARGAKILR
ncbi:low temperature requirement protein A [Micromonospora siamensis]|uniref:low temperature requirement protein A n=1 Tax=Micromonospora siamensis TaxID=299152 RepID=UPI0012FD0137|nr:low temperature requirement protein A [Micromonospora siamensis]